MPRRRPARPRRRAPRAGALVVALLLAGCSGGEELVAGADGPPPVPDVQVPGTDVQVTGTAPAQQQAGWAGLAREGVARVEDLWGPGAVDRPVRLVLPGDAAGFAGRAGHPVEEQGVPASTVGRGAEAEVVVHPDAWDRLTGAGRRAVLTHEITHLAMQGDGPVPPWLGEGLAEYTAHRGSGVPVEVVAGSALDPVRAGALPTGWPDPTAARSRPATSGASGAGADRWPGYALSWLACLHIAQAHSEEELLHLYRVVASGVPLDQAVPRVLGVGEPELHDEWVTWLAGL